MSQLPAVLVTDQGHVFRGLSWAASGCACGRLVVDTSVTAYQQALTDPANEGAIVLFTSPHIGNVGVHEADAKSQSYCAAGLVLREPARLASNWQSEGELEPALKNENVVGVSHVDTRAIARIAVNNPEVKVGIFSGDCLPEALGELSQSTPIPRSIVNELVQRVKNAGEGEAKCH
ncbi:MAG: carbamoyl-phosphate synthase domain-containing protein [Actinomycetaceae bacterium]|nr:carbamoyl-phosphate synthase domain-containing protein [Actinomycetaceae bacterium]